MKNCFKISLFLLFNFLACDLLKSQNIDSLKHVLKTTPHDTTKLRLMLDICEVSEAYQILAYAKPALALSNKLLNQSPRFSEKINKWLLSKKALAVNDIGFVYYNQGDMPNALKYYEESVKLYEDIGDKAGIALLLNNIACIYDLQGDIPKALSFYSRSLKISEEIGDKNSMANAFNNIGVIYDQQNDNPKALLYYGRALKLYEIISEKKGVASALNNIGNVYDKIGDTAKTLYYNVESLKIMEEIRNKQGIASLLINIGDFYKKRRQILITLDYYKKALKIFSEIKDKQSMATTFRNIGVIYFIKRDFLIARKYQDSSLALSKALGFPENIRNTEKSISKVDSALGNFFGAFEHYKQYIKFRDSIANEETQKAYITNQLNYEFEKKELLLKEEQEKDRLVVEEKSRFQVAIIWAVAIGMLLVIIFTIFIFRNLQKNKKANIIIKEKQREILDSIHYAKRIQNAFLPSQKYFYKELNRLKKD